MIREMASGPFRRIVTVIVAGLLVSGCTTVQVARGSPQQDRLERLLATVLPHVDHPEAHYWIRVVSSSNKQVDLWVLSQEHIFFSEDLVQSTDDATLTALLAHGIAHHELHHHMKRGVMWTLQYLAFLVGGLFVPGLGFGYLAGGAIVDSIMSSGQEFSADAKTLTYLKPLGYSVDDYIHALEFLAAHHRTERTGGVFTSQQGFALRIAELKKRPASPPGSAQKIGK